MNAIKKLPEFAQKCKPFDHQQECLKLSWSREYFALLLEMGCGKSKIAVDTFASLFITGEINGVVILAPKGVYLNWIKSEIPAHMPDEVDYFVAPWKATMDKKEDARFKQLLKCPEKGVLDILVMNIEGLNVKRGFEAVIKFLETHTALSIIDESTCIKNFKAERTRKAWTVGKLSKYRRIMTGTPITQNPLDLFSQFQFLSPGCLKFTSFSAFRAYYAQMGVLVLGNRSFPRIEGFRNLEQLQKDLIPLSYRKLKTECLDLPPKVYQTRYIEMHPEQRSIYEKFKAQAMIELNSATVTSLSALTTIMKLQQIACGHVVDDNGMTHDLPNGRMDALEEILEEVSGKAIIWCVFRRDVELVRDRLIELYGKESVVTYYGGTSDDDRATALRRFSGKESDADCRWFVGTASTGGMGLTLVDSNTTIYYSNGCKLLDRLQSEDRNHRIGQTKTVDVIDIVCTKSTDERIVKLLKGKKELASLVLDNWQEIVLGDLEDF